MTRTHAAPLEAVIFDLGNVLIALDFERALVRTSELIKCPVAAVRKRLFQSGPHPYPSPQHPAIRFEVGELSGQEFHRALAQLLDYPLSYASFEDIWNCIFTHEIEPTVGLVRELNRRPGLKVGILSNTNSVHLSHLTRRMSVFKELRHVYASHELGCRKPGASIYRRVLKRMQVPPERAVMVDDLAENIEAARAVGMYGVHATGPEAVRQGLAKLGVL